MKKQLAHQKQYLRRYLIETSTHHKHTTMKKNKTFQRILFRASLY